MNLEQFAAVVALERAARELVGYVQGIRPRSGPEALATLADRLVAVERAASGVRAELGLTPDSAPAAAKRACGEMGTGGNGRD